MEPTAEPTNCGVWEDENSNEGVETGVVGTGVELPACAGGTAEAWTGLRTSALEVLVSDAFTLNMASMTFGEAAGLTPMSLIDAAVVFAGKGVAGDDARMSDGATKDPGLGLLGLS